jgi:tRNA (adenine22-N1)-methyltransferase
MNSEKLNSTFYPDFYTRRLMALQSLIPISARCVADIGYDHGRLIKQLLQSRKNLRVVGVELQPHYAERFRKRYAQAPQAQWQRLAFRTGSGLGPLGMSECDVLVLAGMGETTISNILQAHAEKLKAVDAIVTAPSHYFVKLRAELAGLGFYTDREVLVRERGKFYHLARAIPGKDPREGHWSWFIAPRLFEQRHPMLYEFLMYLKPFLAVRAKNRASQPPAFQHFLEHFEHAVEIAATFRTHAP